MQNTTVDWCGKNLRKLQSLHDDLICDDTKGEVKEEIDGLLYLSVQFGQKAMTTLPTKTKNI